MHLDSRFGYSSSSLGFPAHCLTSKRCSLAPTGYPYTERLAHPKCALGTPESHASQSKKGTEGSEVNDPSLFDSNRRKHKRNELERMRKERNQGNQGNPSSPTWKTTRMPFTKGNGFSESDKSRLSYMQNLATPFSAYKGSSELENAFPPYMENNAKSIDFLGVYRRLTPGVEGILSFRELIY